MKLVVRQKQHGPLIFQIIEDVGVIREACSEVCEAMLGVDPRLQLMQEQVELSGVVKLISSEEWTKVSYFDLLCLTFLKRTRNLIPKLARVKPEKNHTRVQKAEINLEYSQAVTGAAYIWEFT